LAGLVPITAGDATVLGHDLRRDAKAVRRHVGLLGHGAALYDDLTVAENVRFWAKASRGGDADAAMDRAGIDARVRDVIGARLSAGQRRRASLAMLFARAPKLWLLDEPHAGLDAAGRDALDAEIRRATGEGITVLVASHELDRASALATRTITVAGGHLVHREPTRVA
jgi:ABC-type multidrug transport system ATPase subunit